MPVIAWERARRDGAPLPKVKDTHRRAAESLSPSDHDWLAVLPYQLQLPDLEVLVVHAGLDPRVSLRAQAPNTLINVRSILSDGTPSRRVDDGVPWASVWGGPLHVVFGHDAVRKIQRHPFATGLDSGCVYGGELTALDLPSGRLVRVPARRAWCPI